MPLYVYFMDSVGKKETCAKNPIYHVGISHSPVDRVRQHNSYTGSFRGKVKKTARGCPNWVLRMVVGPFSRHSHAFAGAWKSACRRHISKQAAGLLLAHRARKRVVCLHRSQVCKEARQDFQAKKQKYLAMVKKAAQETPELFG